MLPRPDGYCAQDEDIWTPSTFEPGTAINLFFQWDGGAPVDEGFVVLLPSEWTVTAATVVRQAYRHIHLETVNLSGGQYLLSSPEPLRSPCDLILQILTDQNSVLQNHRIAVGPATMINSNYVLDEGHVRRGELRAKPNAESGSALEFRENEKSLHIHPQWLDALHHSHTLEFWIQTTALNAVVLSSWDGAESNPYHIELVVDARGRMRYYRNTTGQHVTLSTSAPVANGIWQHVSLVHNAETYWTKLYLNGQIADSLLDPAGTELHRTLPIALGGRTGSSKTPSTSAFKGKLDDLRIWPSARTATQIGAMMQQTVKGTDMIVLDFESAESFRYFQEPEAMKYRARGGPMFDPLVYDFRGIIFDQGVMLTWKNEDSRSASFRIERSEDGIRFDEIARIQQPFEDEQWSYTDSETPTPVIFYRLVQELQGQAPRVTGIIKLGLGPEIIPASIEILGNYPNPFNPQTLISYEVREPQHLRLSIINLSGHVVADLVDRFHETGVFEASWDGTELSSGTYFVRLQGQDGIMRTRQILLAK